MPIHLLIYIFSFVGIWIGSGLAISSVERLSKLLNLSSFTVSFVVLGFFTSLSELSVGINSIITKNPEIYVGNLIGASIVLLMLVIPLLAIFGKNIHINPRFQGFALQASLVVIALPAILAVDSSIDSADSMIAIVLYLILILAIQSKKGLVEKISDLSTKSNTKIGTEILKAFFGVILIFIASKFLVEQTIYYSKALNLPSFVISLLLIAIGTNIPELSLVIRSIFKNKYQIAFGDFVGSASFNSFLIGILTLFNGKSVQLTNSYIVSLLFLIVGLFYFYTFAKTKNSISRIEGLFMLSLYIMFLITEIYLHKNSFMQFIIFTKKFALMQIFS